MPSNEDILISGKEATEARDLLDYDILSKRVLKLEKVSINLTKQQNYCICNLIKFSTSKQVI